MKYNLLYVIFLEGLISREVYLKNKGLLDGIWPSKKFESKGFEVNVGGEMSISNSLEPERLNINYKKDNLVSSFEMEVIKKSDRRTIFGQFVETTVEMEYKTKVKINADNGYYVIEANYSDKSSMGCIRELYFDVEAIACYRQNAERPSDSPTPYELQSVGLEPDVKLSAWSAKSYLTDIFRNSIFMDGRDLIRKVENIIMENRERKTTPASR